MAQLLADDGENQPTPTPGRNWSGQCSRFSNTRTSCGLAVWCAEAGARVKLPTDDRGYGPSVGNSTFLDSVTAAWSDLGVSVTAAAWPRFSLSRVSVSARTTG